MYIPLWPTTNMHNIELIIDFPVRPQSPGVHVGAPKSALIWFGGKRRELGEY